MRRRDDHPSESAVDEALAEVNGELFVFGRCRIVEQGVEACARRHSLAAAFWVEQDAQDQVCRHGRTSRGLGECTRQLAAVDPCVAQLVPQHFKTNAHDNVGGTRGDDRFVRAWRFERPVGRTIRFDSEQPGAELGQPGNAAGLETEEAPSFLP